jgi:hypothetical protein
MQGPRSGHEGNIRFAGLPSDGWPEDPEGLSRRVRTILDDQNADHYGPPTVIVSTPPGELPSSLWDCVVGVAVTGLPQASQGLVIEDYRDLAPLVLPHLGAVRDLPATWARLQARARELGRRLRPYWRVRLSRTRLADGNLLPLAEVAAFLER